MIIDKNIETYLRDRRNDPNYKNDYYTWPTAKKKIEQTFSKCTIKDDQVIPDDHHDRYIIIDNGMQILLSSGFEYLGQSSKDFTYVISSEVKQF